MIAILYTIVISYSAMLGSCGIIRGLILGCPNSTGVIEALHEQDMEKIELRRQELQNEAARQERENATERDRAILRATSQAFEIEAKATMQAIQAVEETERQRIAADKEIHADSERTIREQNEQRAMTERLYKEQMEKTKRHGSLMVTVVLLCFFLLIWQFFGALLEFFRMLFGFRLVQQYGPAIAAVEYPAITGNEKQMPYAHFMASVERKNLTDEQWDVIEDPDTESTYGVVMSDNPQLPPNMYLLTDDLQGKSYG